MNEKELVKYDNKNLKDLLKNKQVRTNLIIFCIINCMQMLTMFLVTIAADMIFGGTYFVIILYSIVEALSSIFAGELVLRFKVRNLLYFSQIVIGIVLMLFYF